jgi:hypothetical protein
MAQVVRIVIVGGSIAGLLPATKLGDPPWNNGPSFRNAD